MVSVLLGVCVCVCALCVTLLEKCSERKQSTRHAMPPIVALSLKPWFQNKEEDGDRDDLREAREERRLCGCSAGASQHPQASRLWAQDTTRPAGERRIGRRAARKEVAAGDKEGPEGF